MRAQAERYGLSPEEASRACDKLRTVPALWGPFIQAADQFARKFAAHAYAEAKQVKLEDRLPSASPEAYLPERSPSASPDDSKCFLPLAKSTSSKDPVLREVLVRSCHSTILMPEITENVVRALGVVGFHSLAQASRTAERETAAAALVFFTDFSYRPDVFGSRRAGSRILSLSETEQSQRLVRFLTSSRLFPCLIWLDLRTAPVAALYDAGVQNALFKMPRLESLKLPESGWATPQERLKIVRLVPEHVVAQAPKSGGSVEHWRLERRSQVPALRATAPSDVERRSVAPAPRVAAPSNVEAAVIEDVPAGHAAHHMVIGPKGAHPFYSFKYNGQPYQTTVGRTGGSHENAARIARLLYARLASGVGRADTLAYREELYSLCAPEV